MIVNEDGIPMNLPENFKIGNNPIYGNVFFITNTKREFKGLTAEQVDWLLDWWDIDMDVEGFTDGALSL